MAFQINGQTVINNSRVASSMSGVAALAHDEDEWNTASYTFNSGFGNWSAGTVNFLTQSIQPNSFEDFDQMYINLDPTNIGGAPNTFGGNVTMEFGGSTGSDPITIIPSSWSIDAATECWIFITHLTSNEYLVETFLADQAWDPSFTPPMPLNLQNTYYVQDTTFSSSSTSFASIEIDWPTWGGGTNLSMVHKSGWR